MPLCGFLLSVSVFVVKLVFSRVYSMMYQRAKVQLRYTTCNAATFTELSKCVVLLGNYWYCYLRLYSLAASQIYTESIKKTSHYNIAHNFAKC